MRRFEYIDNVISDGVEMLTPNFDLPKRATTRSMAYDIYSPESFEIAPKEIYMLKTGITAKMREDEGLVLNVRSSMGKKHIMLANSSGWVDSDYYPNEIGLLFYNYGEETWKVEKGDRVAQAMFINFLTIDDDNANGVRKDGFGSTGK